MSINLQVQVVQVHFFSQRAVNRWNSLSQEEVNEWMHHQSTHLKTTWREGDEGRWTSSWTNSWSSSPMAARPVRRQWWRTTLWRIVTRCSRTWWVVVWCHSRQTGNSTYAICLLFNPVWHCDEKDTTQYTREKSTGRHRAMFHRAGRKYLPLIKHSRGINWPIRGAGMTYWKCICSASNWLFSCSLSGSSILLSPSRGTLQPKPFKSEKRVKRKLASRSNATGSNGRRTGTAISEPITVCCSIFSAINKIYNKYNTSSLVHFTTRLNDWKLEYYLSGKNNVKHLLHKNTMKARTAPYDAQASNPDVPTLV